MDMNYPRISLFAPIGMSLFAKSDMIECRSSRDVNIFIFTSLDMNLYESLNVYIHIERGAIFVLCQFTSQRFVM